MDETKKNELIGFINCYYMINPYTYYPVTIYQDYTRPENIEKFLREEFGNKSFDHCIKPMSPEDYNYMFLMISLARSYFQAGQKEEAERVLSAPLFKQRESYSSLVRNGYPSSVSKMALEEFEPESRLRWMDFFAHLDAFRNELDGKYRGVSEVILKTKARIWNSIFGEFFLRFYIDQNRGKVWNHYLVCGETGVGKQIVAEAIAKALGRGFFDFNCASRPNKDLIAGELMGTRKGAYTDATRKDGILKANENKVVFLDEISEIPVDAQAALLKVVETDSSIRPKISPLGTESEEILVDVVIVAATNRITSKEEIDSGTPKWSQYLRHDLIDRFGKKIFLPSLKDMKFDDLVEILSDPDTDRETIYEFLEKNEHTRWERNVRTLLNKFEEFRAEHSPSLPFLFNNGEARERTRSFHSRILDCSVTTEELLTWYVRRVYEKTGENYKKTEEITGLSRNTIKKYLNREKGEK